MPRHITERTFVNWSLRHHNREVVQKLCRALRDRIFHILVLFLLHITVSNLSRSNRSYFKKWKSLLHWYLVPLLLDLVSHFSWWSGSRDAYLRTAIAYLRMFSMCLEFANLFSKS